MEDFHRRNLPAKINGVEQSRLEKLETDYLSLMYTQGSSHITHYFRVILNILKFVEKADLSDLEKEIYTEILWGQLSREELALIFYHSISEIGKDEMLPLCKKYGFLEYISSTSVLLFPNDIDFADEILKAAILQKR
ncbi:MAG: hypothetical protein E6Q59_01980 [Nitrosomonas sp.]|nr:putative phage abortive infection protein [Nitrosomonas sp.]OQW80786.1 MAG: hypothetical protein BVN30_12695 [Proteobacteria bacterium ST_bin16]TXI41525.1 MAG: hypothetical protein E6Q59_01980 [Nitrosomonas sp.]